MGRELVHDDDARADDLEGYLPDNAGTLGMAPYPIVVPGGRLECDYVAWRAHYPAGGSLPDKHDYLDGDIGSARNDSLSDSGRPLDTLPAISTCEW
jgi:hypothetical protein